MKTNTEFVSLVQSAIAKSKTGISAPAVADLYPKQCAKLDAKFPRVAARKAMQALGDAGKVDLYYVGRTLVATLPGRNPNA